MRSDLRDHGGWVIDDAGGVVGFVIVQRRGTRAAEILWAAVAADRQEQASAPGSSTMSWTS